MKQLKFWKNRGQRELKEGKPEGTHKKKYKKLMIVSVLVLAVLTVAVKAMMPKEVVLPRWRLIRWAGAISPRRWIPPA